MELPAGEIGAEPAAQLVDRLDAVAAVEVVVDQEPVRRHLGFRNDRDRARKVGCLEHAAAPTVEQRLHAVEDGKIVVDAQHRDARKRDAIDLAQRARLLAHRPGG